MINKDDILNLLAAGKSVDEIAADMADTLNAAKAEHDEKVAREVEEMKRLSAENDAKREAMRDAMGAFAYYILTFTNLADDLDEDELNKLTLPTDEDVDEVCGLVESLSGTIKLLNGLKDLEFGFKPKVEEVSKVDLFDDMMRALGFRRS